MTLTFHCDQGLLIRILKKKEFVINKEKSLDNDYYDHFGNIFTKKDPNKIEN